MLLSDLRNEYLEKKAQYDAYVKEAGSGEAFDISKLSIEGNTEISKAHSYRKFLESLVESKNALDNVIAMDLATDVLRQVAPSKGLDYQSFKKEASQTLVECVDLSRYRFTRIFESIEELKTSLAFTVTPGADDIRITPAIEADLLLLSVMNMTTTSSGTVKSFNIAGSNPSNSLVRSLPLQEAAYVYGQHNVEMKRIGAWQPMAREITQDSIRFETAVLDRLFADLRYDLAKESLVGPGGATGRIEGFATKFANFSVPAQDRPNIYSDLRSRVYDQLANGLPTSGIITTVADGKRVTEAIEKAGAKLGETEDLSIYPLGSVLGVPVIPFPQMTANNIILGPYKTRAEIIIRNRIELASTAETPEGFPKNELALRAVVEANTLMYHLDDFVRIDDTNNYDID